MDGRRGAQALLPPSPGERNQPRHKTGHANLGGGSNGLFGALRAFWDQGVTSWDQELGAESDERRGGARQAGSRAPPTPRARAGQGLPGMLVASRQFPAALAPKAG